VATDGSTKDIEIVESTDPIFENASIESVEKYRYRPRVIDNTPVEVAGVTTSIVFELGEDID
jgi:protein TonB